MKRKGKHREIYKFIRKDVVWSDVYCISKLVLPDGAVELHGTRV